MRRRRRRRRVGVGRRRTQRGNGFFGNLKKAYNLYADVNRRMRPQRGGSALGDLFGTFGHYYVRR